MNNNFDGYEGLVLKNQYLFIELLMECNEFINIIPAIRVTGMRERSEDESTFDYYSSLYSYLCNFPDKKKSIIELIDKVSFYFENSSNNRYGLADINIEDLKNKEKLSELLNNNNQYPALTTIVIIKKDITLFENIYDGYIRIMRAKLGVANIPKSNEENKFDTSELNERIKTLEQENSRLISKTNTSKSELNKNYKKLEKDYNELNNEKYELEEEIKRLKQRISEGESLKLIEHLEYIKQLEEQIDDLRKNKYEEKEINKKLSEFYKGKWITIMGEFHEKHIKLSLKELGINKVNFISSINPRNSLEQLTYAELVIFHSLVAAHSTYYLAKRESKNFYHTISLNFDRIKSILYNHLIKQENK